MSNIRDKKAELLSTNDPMLEEQLEQGETIVGLLNHEEKNTFAKFLTDYNFLLEMDDLTAVHQNGNYITFENEDYFWEFLVA